MVPVILRTCCLLSLAACTCASCARDPRLPDDVTEIYVRFSQSELLKTSRHFEVEYDVGEYLTNHKPEPGVKYKERIVFRGEIMPLAVKENGELSLPLSYFVIKLPFYQTEIRPWRPGDHITISSYGLYRFKLRTGERGLIFAIIPHEGEDMWIYPGDCEPIAPSSIPEKQVESLGKSIRCVEIPAPSSLLRAKPEVRRVVRSLKGW